MGITGKVFLILCTLLLVFPFLHVPERCILKLFMVFHSSSVVSMKITYKPLSSTISNWECSNNSQISSLWLYQFSFCTIHISLSFYFSQVHILFIVIFFFFFYQERSTVPRQYYLNICPKVNSKNIEIFQRMNYSEILLQSSVQALSLILPIDILLRHCIHFNRLCTLKFKLKFLIQTNQCSTDLQSMPLLQFPVQKLSSSKIRGQSKAKLFRSLV